MVIKNLYGEFSFNDSIFAELIESVAVQRLKGVLQSGVVGYIEPAFKDWTRYEHSMGVLSLTLRYNASHHEQIAAVLHDVSHTAFSHVGDLVFSHCSSDCSYQDHIHEWFLRQAELDKILMRHGIDLTTILHKSGEYKILEQDLPDICADRLDYNLMAAVKMEWLSPDGVDRILSNLFFENGRWFFRDSTIARDFALLVLRNNEDLWGASFNCVTYDWAAQALKRALALDMITEEEIHFSCDDLLWHRMQVCGDKQIEHLIDNILHYTERFALVTPGQEDKVFYGKFRGIDPWILEKSTFKRLSEVDSSFKQEYVRLKELLAQGWHIKYLS